MNQLKTPPACDAERLADSAAEPVVDLSVLGPLLEMGNAELRRALCQQLVADFRRIDAGLNHELSARVAAHAHELKGLAGTIGAHRLADMARSLHATAGMVGPSALEALVLPVRSELARVVIILVDCEQSCNK